MLFWDQFNRLQKIQVVTLSQTAQLREKEIRGEQIDQPIANQRQVNYEDPAAQEPHIIDDQQGKDHFKNNCTHVCLLAN